MITLGNGPLVLSYLATTRRWRGSGLLLVALAVVAYEVGFDPAHVNFEFAWLFVGWFGGAVITEWRVAAPEAGARRIASLHRRALGDYLRSRSLHVLAGSSLAVGGYFATLIVRTLVTSPNSAIVGVAGAVGLLFLPILGVITALAPAQPRQRHPDAVIA